LRVGDFPKGRPLLAASGPNGGIELERSRQNAKLLPAACLFVLKVLLAALALLLSGAWAAFMRMTARRGR